MGCFSWHYVKPKLLFLAGVVILLVLYAVVPRDVGLDVNLGLEMEAEAPRVERTRVLAYFFPFAPDPLNDRLWGEGFTEWNHLKSAPALNRHGKEILQPLEYYDPLSRETRTEQAKLAREHGVDGFIFHHYWFHRQDVSGPTLNLVLEQMLDDGQPNVSFALNWCNTDWTPHWNGKAEHDFRVEQLYPHPGSASIRSHYMFLRRFFKHPNYVKVEGVPLLFVLNSEELRAAGVLIQLRKYALKDGFPGLSFVSTLSAKHPTAPTQFNKAFPSFNQHPVYQADLFYPHYVLTTDTCARRLPQWCRDGHRAGSSKRPHFLGVIASFDNTPRRTLDTARIFQDCNMEENFRVLMQYTNCCTNNRVQQRIAVINAWNEWGEGMALEPSKSKGLAHLNAVAKVVKESKSPEFCRFGKKN